MDVYQMLNCILGMVEKPQRAIRILQQRQTSSTTNNRTTEEVVADLQVIMISIGMKMMMKLFWPKSPQTRANLAILEVTTPIYFDCLQCCSCHVLLEDLEYACAKQRVKVYFDWSPSTCPALVSSKRSTLRCGVLCMVCMIQNPLCEILSIYAIHSISYWLIVMGDESWVMNDESWVMSDTREWH